MAWKMPEHILGLHSEEPQAPDLYYAWLKHRPEFTTASQPVTTQTLIIQGVVVTNPPTNVSIPTQESSPTVKSVERYLKDQGEQNTNQARYYSLPTWYGGSATNTTSTTSHQPPVPAQSKEHVYLYEHNNPIHRPTPLELLQLAFTRLISCQHRRRPANRFGAVHGYCRGFGWGYFSGW